ncbi:NAD(P)-binding protein [Rhizopogon salebrosus TDB-379]|nr:NAD(P)-binding protein [Rhizopogon salebrosus TDB-379]
MPLGKAVHPDTDFFSQGFDSLSATFLKNRIIGSLRSSSDTQLQESASRIQQSIIFFSPSIRKLARCVVNTVLPVEGPVIVDAKAHVENMIKKYSVGFEDSARDSAATLGGYNGGDHAVVLTGSTGGIGSYLLASLLRREDVSVVYAFNRPSTALSIQQRQRSTFEDRGLDVTLLESEKLAYVETDTSHDGLGLDKGLYQKICASVTTIIHNSRLVDLNLALSSFESQVRGMRNLIDLAQSSPRHPRPRFMFTSSISSIAQWDTAKGPIPEEVQYDAGVAVGFGYGESKYVSERILDNSKLPASSFRIGQVTGGHPRGAWSTTEWFPMIIKSSVSMGALPDAQAPGLTDWLPPYAISSAILDVAFAEERPPIAVNLITGGLLPLVPFSEWLEKLDLSAKDANEENINRIPAIKPIDYIYRMYGSGRKINAFATGVAQRISPTMRELDPLSSADAALWMDYWASVGMFQ